MKRIILLVALIAMLTSTKLLADTVYITVVNITPTEITINIANDQVLKWGFKPSMTADNIALYRVGNNGTIQLKPNGDIDVTFAILPNGPVLTSNTKYVVDIDYNGNNIGASGTGIDHILLTAPIALPVTFTSFNGVNKGLYNMISWSTATETNCEKFVLERRCDNGEFKVIAEVAGSGNSNTPRKYSINDYMNACDVLYYRIKQVDFDGKFEYTKIISVKRSTNNKDFYGFNIGYDEEPKELLVYNSSGKLIKTLDLKNTQQPTFPTFNEIVIEVLFTDKSKYSRKTIKK